MKTGFISKSVVLLLFIPVTLIIFHSCEKPATGFDEEDDAIYYTKSQKADVPVPDSTIRVMTVLFIPKLRYWKNLMLLPARSTLSALMCCFSRKSISIQHDQLMLINSDISLIILILIMLLMARSGKHSLFQVTDWDGWMRQMLFYRDGP
jgi:hypothetical protein